MILYFSATGNTKWVAQQLSTFLCDNRLFSISDVEGDIFASLGKEESLGFCFPVHAWGIPAPMREKIMSLSAMHLTPYIYMVCTCGDDCGKTADEFSDLLAKNFHKPSFMASVRMPNTYVNLPGFDVDSKKLIQRKKAEAVPQVELIAAAIRDRKEENWVHEGLFPSLKSGLLRMFFQKFLVTDRYFRLTDDCIGCGKCAKVCPSNNILMVCEEPEWLHNGTCTTCMNCYHHCPRKAIQFGKFTAGKGQYYFK